MYAKVSFVKKDETLSDPYDYSIDNKLAYALEKDDFVLVESSRSVYGVGVFVGLADEVSDPSIVTKAVLQRLDVPSYAEYLKGVITNG